jgi:hypothetical protein
MFSLRALKLLVCCWLMLSFFHCLSLFVATSRILPCQCVVQWNLQYSQTSSSNCNFGVINAHDTVYLAVLCVQSPRKTGNYSRSVLDSLAFETFQVGYSVCLLPMVVSHVLLDVILLVTACVELHRWGKNKKGKEPKSQLWNTNVCECVCMMSVACMNVSWGYVSHDIQDWIYLGSDSCFSFSTCEQWAALLRVKGLFMARYIWPELCGAKLRCEFEVPVSLLPLRSLTFK